MAVLAIQTFDNPFYDMNVTLEGVEYRLDFAFNERERAWYFSIIASDGTELVTGIKVVCKRSLVRRSDPRLPPGTFIAIATDGIDAPPDLTHLGGATRLMYVTSDHDG